ncbi:MAG: hypothetical protein ABR985_22445 [Methanotrichaceae archaeon]
MGKVDIADIVIVSAPAMFDIGGIWLWELELTCFFNCNGCGSDRACMASMAWDRNANTYTPTREGATRDSKAHVVGKFLGDVTTIVRCRIYGTLNGWLAKIEYG